MGKDIYGLGQVSFIVTFCLICLVLFSNIIFSPSAEFFYIYPVVYGVLFCHAQYVHSPRERNQIFFAYIFLLSISIFCFTLLGYLKMVLLLFTISWAYLLLSKTTEPAYKLYGPITGTVLVMSLVLTQRGTLGIFNIALDRFLAILTMGIIILAALHYIPSKLYERVWRKAMIQFLKDLGSYIDATNQHNTQYHLDQLCQHICVVDNSLNYLTKEKQKLDPRLREDDELRLHANGSLLLGRHPRASGDAPPFRRHPRASGDPGLLYKECFESLHTCYLNLIYLTQHSLINQGRLDYFNALLHYFVLTLQDGNVMTPLTIDSPIMLDKQSAELHAHFANFVTRWNKLCIR